MTKLKKLPVFLIAVLFFIFNQVTFAANLQSGLGIDNNPIPISPTRPPTVNTDLGNLGNVTEGGVTYETYYDNATGNFVAVGGARNDDDDNGPVDRDPRAYERWRVIGDIDFWGTGYDYINRPCTGAPGEDKNRCNNSCTALKGWACDTRAHERPVALHIYVNGVFYDAFFPTGSRSGLTNWPGANTSKYNYTPNCGSNPGNLYGFSYPTPVAWKDGRTRWVQIYAVAASSTINGQYYRNDTRLKQPSPYLTSSELLMYGISSPGSVYSSRRVRYRFIYGNSDAPTNPALVNAGWREGMSAAYKNFPVTCAPLPSPAVDLSGQLLAIKNQVVNRPYTIIGTVRNLGTRASGRDIPLTLQFDFGRNGFTNGSGNDFTVNTTMRALVAGASFDNPFTNISHSQLGAWQVRMIVDQSSTIEADPLTRPNNVSSWQPFLVTVAPGTPTLNLVANTPVKIGEQIGLGWIGANIRKDSCVASGAWTGLRREGGYLIIPATQIGTLTFTLSCVGTDNQPITDTAVVQVIGTTPDLSFINVGYTTCTPAQQNGQTGRCPATTVRFAIRNQGPAIPANVPISYQLERIVDAAWVPVPGAAGTIAGLGAAANSAIITKNVPNLPAGVLQRFRLQVNNPPTRNPAIGELIFANNATATSYFTLPIPASDYTFTAFTVTGTCPNTGTQNYPTGKCPRTTVSLTIKNNGASTPAGQVIGYTIEESGTTLFTGTIPALAAGASRTVPVITISNLGVGRHTLRAEVNPARNSNLRETNFTNNVSNPDDVVVPPLPPQCSNKRHDDSDNLIDRADPGCYGNGNPNVPGDYDPTDDSEADSSAVVPVPSVFSLTAANQVVRFDTPTAIRYQITNAAPMNCVLQGPGTNRTFLYTMNSVVDQTLPTSNLKSAQSFSLTCTPILIGPAITRTLQIEVIPQVQEV